MSTRTAGVRGAPLRGRPGAVAFLLLSGLVLVGTACLPSRPPPRPDPPSKKLARTCDLTDAPITRDQALCIARSAGAGREEGTYTIRAGASLADEPIWVLRESCERVPRCVELWIRRADGAIVNTRYLYAFENY